MTCELEADSTGISLLFDNSYGINTVTNYFKNTLVGGGFGLWMLRMLIFFERSFMKDKLDIKTDSLYLKASYLLYSV